MITHEFSYRKPETLEEASTLLMENKNSQILAGGTDLLVKLRKGNHRPDLVVDIKRIPRLCQLEWKEKGLFIGAGITITGLKNSNEVKKFFPALHQATFRFGCYEVRNRATVGGNICNASPGAECGGPAVVYEARVEIFGNGKFRQVPINEFLTGPGWTSLEPGEIMTGLILPRPPENSVSAYRRTARVKGQDLATCAITILAVNPEKPSDRKIRAGLSAVMKTPFRSPELEEILSHKAIDSKVLKQARTWLKENIYPRASSLRGTPGYKKEVMGGMLEILLEELGLLKKA
ncbi:MAG: FAD binding domain-containing protein [Vulcanimicrobiota bacterium]